jgi:predicted molibdopterin-dependent oxidoreductase YjgC
MFRRLEGDTDVTILVDGQPIPARAGESVAAALLAAGVQTLRHTLKSAAPRGVYCGMGVCFDCLVTIDGAANRQACLAMVQDGMRIETGA